jgi:thiol-disulfide isomerase/thioredoxin
VRRVLLLALGALTLGGVVLGGILLAEDEPAGVVAEQAGGSGIELAGTDPITGKRVELADFAGRPVLVNVWASWCPGCIDEAADLARIAHDYPEIVVLGIDYQDSKANARTFYRKWAWRHPSIFDPDGRLAAEISLTGMPTTVVLDREHRIVARIVGATDYAGFERAIERVV